MSILSTEQIAFIDDKIIYMNSLSQTQEEELLNADDEDTLLLNWRLKDFEKLQTSEELHYLITYWNWDEGNFMPKLVLKHPECDRGTALLIYWLIDPDHFSKFDNEENVPRYSLDNYRLLKEVETLLLNGFFQKSKVKFNPRAYASWESLNNEKIPDQLKKATEGEEFIF